MILLRVFVENTAFCVNNVKKLNKNLLQHFQNRNPRSRTLTSMLSLLKVDKLTTERVYNSFEWRNQAPFTPRRFQKETENYHRLCSTFAFWVCVSMTTVRRKSSDSSVSTAYCSPHAHSHDFMTKNSNSFTARHANCAVFKHLCCFHGNGHDFQNVAKKTVFLLERSCKTAP